jgi:hypothetical protein
VEASTEDHPSCRVCIEAETCKPVQKKDRQTEGKTETKTGAQREKDSRSDIETEKEKVLGIETGKVVEKASNS